MRDAIDLKRTMSVVILALVPCVLFSFYNTGYQHFLALSGMTGDATPGAYASGWLQWLVFGADYLPAVGSPAQAPAPATRQAQNAQRRATSFRMAPP